MVEDFCAECVEPAPGAACEKQDAGPALDGQNGAGSSGYESDIRAANQGGTAGQRLVPICMEGTALFCFGGNYFPVK